MVAPSLSRVAQSGGTLPDRIVLYGPPGWGKTSFAAHLPKPIFLMTPGEDRLLKLIEQGLIPPTGHFQDLAMSWNHVELAISELLVQPHDYLTFVLDTGNGAERLAQECVCENEFGGDWGEGGFNSFGRGEKIAANRIWFPFLSRLDELRARRRMRIVLCCHAGVRPTKNPDGPDYDKIEPALSRMAWGATSKWADMILCGALETMAQRDDPKNKAQKAKGKGGRVRLLHCSPSAAYEAKNCHRLPATVRLGEDPLQAFGLFRAAFPKKPEADKPPVEQPAPVITPPAATTNGKPPPSGEAFAKRLQEYDAKRAAEGVWEAGALIKHVVEAGMRAGYPEELSAWTPDGVKLARKLTEEFEASCRAAAQQPEPTPEPDPRDPLIRQAHAAILSAGHTWCGVLTAHGAEFPEDFIEPASEGQSVERVRSLPSVTVAVLQKMLTYYAEQKTKKGRKAS